MPVQAIFPGNLVADGRFYGSVLTLTQRALKRKYPNIIARGYYGSRTRDAIMDIQRRAHLTPTGNIGRKVWGVLNTWYLNDSDARAINKVVLAKRAAEAQASAAASRSNKVGRIINAGMVMIAHRSAVHYTQGSMRWQGMSRRLHLPDYPTYCDCSSAVTWLYYQAGCPDPNGHGYTAGYTGTLAQHGRAVPVNQAAPGDLVLYGPAPVYSHVGCVMAGSGGSARIFSHGSESGPLYVAIGYRPIGQVRRYDLT